MVSNITWSDADALVTNLEQVKGVKEVAFDNSEEHYKGTNALFDVTFEGTQDDEISKNAKKRSQSFCPVMIHTFLPR